MPLNSSGTMSIGGSTEGQSINLELFRAATANSNLNESALRSLAGVPSGAISLSNFYGKVNVIPRGYFCGGGGVGTGALTQIDGIQFSNDTSINPAAALALGRYAGAGVNSSIKGYICSGQDSSELSTVEIDGLAFQTETAINPSAALTVPRARGAGVSSSSVGYVLAGGGYSEIDGINFSTEAAVNPSATVNSSGVDADGHGLSSTTHGYTLASSVALGFVFSTETSLGILAWWSASMDFTYSTQSRAAGYIGGGVNGSSEPNPYTHKFLFSTHTMSTPGWAWTGESGQGVDSDVKGYMPVNSSSYFSTLTFNTETQGSTAAGLAEHRLWPATIQSGWV